MHSCAIVKASVLDADSSKQLDELGCLSGESQQLNGPITSSEKLAAAGQTQTLLLCRDGASRVQGYIKYGLKDLYLYRNNGSILTCSPPCLLDFYVHESVQRGGLGLRLFQAMLEDLGVAPHLIAYDRPSPKLISFMRKHFGLTKPSLQPNRYCLFEGFPL